MGLVAPFVRIFRNHHCVYVEYSENVAPSENILRLKRSAGRMISKSFLSIMFYLLVTDVSGKKTQDSSYIASLSVLISVLLVNFPLVLLPSIKKFLLTGRQMLVYWVTFGRPVIHFKKCYNCTASRWCHNII